jgi:hypothetical protein
VRFAPLLITTVIAANAVVTTRKKDTSHVMAVPK